MSKPIRKEKELLVITMRDLRDRTKIDIPQIVKIFHENLGSELKTHILENTFRNHFFGHLERASSYSQKIVLDTIRTYHDYAERPSICDETGSITLLEAVLILSWTHCSLSAYVQLAEIFGVDNVVLQRMINFVLDCEEKHIFDSDDWSKIHLYCDAVYNDRPSRPWDGQ